MKRRVFVERLGQGLTLAGLGTIMSCKSSDEPLVTTTKLPRNWLWLRPDISLSTSTWKDKLLEIKHLGFDAILPQIYAGVDALFHIENHKVKDTWLEKIIPIAHEVGLEVHAWMWTMPCNNERIINNHPDWFVVNRKGEAAHTHPAYVNYYKFLCPRHPEVRKFVQQRVQALANIKNLDGIHLDYVRMPDVILAEALQPKYDIVQDREYPQYDYCYCALCRESFNEKFDLDPMTLDNPAEDQNWYQHRYDAVVELVNDFLVPVAKAKEKIITAAVFPNWESVRQQWHLFDLDAFLPMLYQGFYNKEVPWIGDEVEKALVRLDNSKPIYSGLFLGHLKGPKLEEAIQHSYEKGAKGIAVFSYGDWDEAFKEKLKEALKA